MPLAVFRFAVLLVLGALSFASHAENNTLVGKWHLINGNDKAAVGTLSATPKFFTLALEQPKASFTAGYNQSPNGDFRCTIIDKNVLVMEGRFKDKDTITIDVMVKEIGKPETKNWAIVAVRDE